MLPKRMTVPIIAFLVLSGGVAANVFFLQSGGRDGRGFDATAWNIAAIEAAEVGDTGSIGKTGNATPPANGLSLAALSTDTPPPKAGDGHELTLAVQRELQIRGYATGGRTGSVDTMTRAAILAFEHDHGLPLTARASDDLLKAILLGESGKKGQKPAKLETPEAQAVIRDVQRSLARLGYKAGPPTGRLTPETMRAIRTFEADQALPESGRVSAPLVARLGRLAVAGRATTAR